MASKHAGPTMEELLRLLDQGAMSEIFASATSRQPGSPDFLNTYGVCLLRLGKVYEALTVFNEITLDPDTLRLRSNVPDSFKANLATARLLAKNPKGCLEALRTVRNRKTEYCLRLRDALRRWSHSLPLLQRLAWHLGILPKTSIRLDFAPGELDGDDHIASSFGKEA